MISSFLGNYLFFGIWKLAKLFLPSDEVKKLPQESRLLIVKYLINSGIVKLDNIQATE